MSWGATTGVRPRQHGQERPRALPPVSGAFHMEPCSRGIQHSRSIISETRSRSGNAFKTVKTAVTKTFRNRKAWGKVVKDVQLEQYLHNIRCMTDPKILDSRKRCVEKPMGNKCHIPPSVLPRPLDKCELYDLVTTGAKVPSFYRHTPGLLEIYERSSKAAPPAYMAEMLHAQEAARAAQPESLRQLW